MAGALGFSIQDVGFRLTIRNVNIKNANVGQRVSVGFRLTIRNVNLTQIHQ